MHGGQRKELFLYVLNEIDTMDFMVHAVNTIKINNSSVLALFNPKEDLV